MHVEGPRLDLEQIRRLFGQASDHLNQFLDLGMLVDCIPARESTGYAVVDMVFEDLLLDLVQRGAHRLKLVQDVDAIAILVHHSPDASHLTFDAPQPLRNLRFRSLIHA